MIQNAGNFSTSSNQDISCQSILRVLPLCWNCKNLLNQDFLLLYFRGVFLGNADSSEKKKKKKGIPAAPPSGNIRNSKVTACPSTHVPICCKTTVILPQKPSLVYGCAKKAQRVLLADVLDRVTWSMPTLPLLSNSLLFTLYSNLKDYLQ